MKNKIIVPAIICSLLFVTMTSGCGTPTAPAADDESTPVSEETPQQFTLQFATFWPAGDTQVTEGHHAWAEEISRRVADETPHQVDFEWHYAQALLSMPELFEGTAQGVADLASTCPAYTPGLFPITEAFELPGYNNDNALVSSLTIHEAWKQSAILQEEYAAVKVMHFWATGPGALMTRTPVRSMEDLAGMNIRAVGGTIPWVAALGANPVSFGMSASYENLETNVVNGLLAPTDVLKGFKLAEVTSYITNCPPTYNIVFMKIMNLDTWNSLPPSVQQIFNEVNEKYVVEYGKLRTDQTVAGREYAVSEFGHEVIDLDPAEYQRWVDLIDPIMEEWVTKADAMGLPGQEIIDMVRELDARFSAEFGNYGK